MYTSTNHQTKMDKSISYLLLSFRIVLGFLFLAAGVAKFLYPDSFLNTLAAFAFLPHGLLSFVGMALPTAEIILGLMLITGFFRKLTSVIAAFFALVFIGVNAYSYSLGYSADCGCFGKLVLLPWQSLFLDVAMLLTALAQLAPWHIKKDKDPRSHKQLKRLLAPAASMIMIVTLVISSFVVIAPASAADDSTSGKHIHPAMIFTTEQLQMEQEAYDSAPIAPLAPLQFSVLTASKNLISHLQYTPIERDQGWAGNCWVWAGTGVTEIAMDVQNSVKDRLSIQYFDSNWPGNIDSDWAGCGGFTDWFSNFYNGSDSSHKAIPWSNTNASYGDYYQECSDGASAVAAGSITTTPSYPITSMTAQTIVTHDVSQATAKANIKNILNQNKAVVFSFDLPLNHWNDAFDPFWSTNSETDVWSTEYCGSTWSTAAGHAVLCYGYDDATNSWLMLNSWGTTPNRPHGFFRVSQDINYSCTFTYGIYSYYAYNFETLGIVFPSGPASIQVTSPNGGEPWNALSTHTITWTSSGVTSNVKIELSRDGGSTWTTIIASTLNDGAYDWTVTGPYTTHALIKISSTTPVLNDTSDDAFTIFQSLTVTNPNGGGPGWDYNTTQTINWTSVGLKTTDNVKIELSRNGGGGPWETIVASTTNTGFKTWKVTSPSTSNALIRVSLVANAAVNDISDAVFSINPPTITLTSPLGGGVWDYNTTQNITWTTTGWASSDKVKIDISRDSGANWTVLYASVANTGLKSWKVVSPGSTQARIRVSLVTDPAVTDSSDTDFTIEPPHIFLDSPNGGGVWDYNTSQNVTWHTTGFASKDKVKIEISRDGGANWTVLYASVANTGVKTWKVVSPGSTQARIRVSLAADPSVNDSSDTDFTIEPPHIFLDSPNGTEIWNCNTSQNVTWHTTGFASKDKVKIEISRDGGTGWTVLYASVPNTGLKLWKVTSPGSTNVRIKVSSTTDPSVTDMSDTDFTIVPPYIYLDSPNGGEGWDFNTSQNITWHTTNFASKDKVKIEISRNSGANWTVLYASVANTGLKTWKVTRPSSPFCLIRVSLTTDPTVNDVSDSSFTINDPTITVTLPNGSSNWVVNTTYTIAWTSTGLTSSDKVKIEVSYDGGSHWTIIFASVYNTGSKTWKVVGSPTTTALIRITSITYSIATDNSDVFTIST